MARLFTTAQPPDSDARYDRCVTTFWIAGLVGLGCAVVVFVRGSHHHRPVDLGTVSTQWLAEHRQSHES
jgi:hypothetical protein